MQVLHGILSPIKVRGDQNKNAKVDTSNENSLMPDVTQETVPVPVTETVTSGICRAPLAFFNLCN